VARAWRRETFYDVRVLSEEGGLVASSSGMQVMTDPIDGAPYDTRIVSAMGFTSMLSFQAVIIWSSTSLIAMGRQGGGRSLVTGRRGGIHYGAGALN